MNLEKLYILSSYNNVFPDYYLLDLGIGSIFGDVVHSIRDIEESLKFTLTRRSKDKQRICYEFFETGTLKRGVSKIKPSHLTRIYEYK